MRDDFLQDGMVKMQKEKNSILIICMGVGVRYKNGNKKKDTPIQEKTPSTYENTNYCFEDSGEMIETPFIMEALMMHELPEKLLILGTVGSNWSELYWHFYEKLQQKTGKISEEQEADFWNYLEFLDQIKKNYDYQTDMEQLEELEKKLETVSLVVKQYFQVEVKILLLKYGINREENLKNFQKLYALEGWMDRNRVNEISMDITHSFRSLAFYQFIFIHYLIQVSEYSVTLKNVYYGMFEVNSEMNYTPVVDLNILTDMMEWINGISEVNQYGGTEKIADLLENHDDLHHWLLIFEYAVSTNDFHMMSSALDELMKIDVGDYQDLEPHEQKFLRRLQTDLKERFPGGEKYLTEAKLQLRMTRWYLDQHRYGSGIVLLQETVRTFLTSIMKKAGGTEVEIDEEKFRKQAVKDLEDLAKYIDKDKYSGLSAFYKKGKKKRDSFAHNLFILKNLSNPLEKNKTFEQTKKSCKFMDDYYCELERVMNDIEWQRSFRRDFSAARKMAGAAQLKTTEKETVKRAVFVLGRNEEKSTDWNGIKKEYGLLEDGILYFSPKIVGKYMNSSLSGEEMKLLQKEILEFLKTKVEALQIEDAVILLKTTDYFNQTVLFEYLQKKGYTVKICRKTKTGQISLPKFELVLHAEED